MPQSEHSARDGGEAGSGTPGPGDGPSSDAESPAGARGASLGLSGRRRLLKGLDAAAAAAAWWLFLGPEPLGSAGSAVAAAASLLLLLFLWLLAVEGAEGYPPESGGDGAGAHGGPGVHSVLGAAVVVGALLLLVHAVGAGLGLPALALPGWQGVVGFVAVLALLPAALRLAVRPLLARPGLRPRVLAVGAGEAAGALVEALRQEGGSVYDVVGFVRTGRGAGDDLARRVGEADVDVVVLADPRQVDGPLERPIARCVERGVEVVPLAALVERVAGRVPLDPPEAAAAALPLSPPAARAGHRAVGRALDLMLVAVGLAFFLPVLPLLALAIRLETPGPVFYTQERVGRGGRTFRLWKLRSMVADAEEEGAPRWAAEDDPRITRVGRFLRATHLDEFPQMLNILKGEMSPVGPRPERPEFVGELEREIPHYRMRHAVRPGMAGWALVEHGYASSLEDARRKHEHDLYYVKHQSVWLDLVVLARTLVDSVSLGGR